MACCKAGQTVGDEAYGRAALIETVGDQHPVGQNLRLGTRDAGPVETQGPDGVFSARAVSQPGGQLRKPHPQDGIPVLRIAPRQDFACQRLARAGPSHEDAMGNEPAEPFDGVFQCVAPERLVFLPVEIYCFGQVD